MMLFSLALTGKPSRKETFGECCNVPQDDNNCFYFILCRPLFSWDAGGSVSGVSGGGSVRGGVGGFVSCELRFGCC